MNHLKSYKLFESKNFKDIKEIIQNLEDMSLEFKDNDCDVLIIPNDDIKVKKLSLNLRDLVTSFRQEFYLEVSLSKSILKYSNGGYESLPDWFVDQLRIISDYMESEGFRISYSVRYGADWENFNSIDELASLEALIYRVRLQFLF
jgi:hypothetical protein